MLIYVRLCKAVQSGQKLKRLSNGGKRYRNKETNTRAPWRRGRASVCEIHIDSSDSVLEWGQLTCIALIHGQNVDSAL